MYSLIKNLNTLAAWQAAAMLAGCVTAAALAANLLIWAVLGKPYELVTFMNPLVIAPLVSFPPFLGMFTVAKENRAIRKAYSHRDRRRISNLLTNAEFREAVSMEFNRARALHRDLTILAIQVCNFDQLREQWGDVPSKDVGTELIRRVSLLLREFDFIGQHHELTLVVLPDSGRDYSNRMIGRIKSSLEGSPIELEFQQVAVEVSIGLSTMGPKPGFKQSVETMLGEAAGDCHANEVGQAGEISSDSGVSESDETKAALQAESLDDVLEAVRRT